MSRTIGCLVTTIAVLACGCGTAITYTPLPGSHGRFRSRPTRSVDVYSSGPPNRPHRDVGLLEAEQESDFSMDGTKSMLRKLRAKAARVGCDAICLNNFGSKTTPSLAVDVNHVSSVKTITATCIRYVDDEFGDEADD